MTSGTTNTPDGGDPVEEEGAEVVMEAIEKSIMSGEVDREQRGAEGMKNTPTRTGSVSGMLMGKSMMVMSRR